MSVYKKCCGISGQLVVNEDCLPQMHWIVAIYRQSPFTTFCYLGEILNVGGCCDSAIAARCCSVWCRFRKLLLGITLWYISFRIRGRVYSSCVLSTMLHGSEPWVTNVSDLQLLQRIESSTIRWICGVNPGIHDPGTLLDKLGLCDLINVLRSRRLVRFGHVERSHRFMHQNGQ